MKILHTADWHLGKKLEQFSRLEEQKAVLEEICQIADTENVDAVFIAGDLYDVPNPSVEAIETFYHCLKRLAKNGKRAVIGIAGNHDSPDRIEAPDPLARECGIILSGYPNTEFRPFKLEDGIEILRTDKGFVEIKIPGVDYPIRLILTPYANEVRLKKYLGNENKDIVLRQILENHWSQLASKYFDDHGVNMLMTHLFVSNQGEADESLEDTEEKSVLSLGGARAIFPENFPAGLQYVALGHIHSRLFIQKEPFPILYSSSPLCYSIDDRQKVKSVSIIEAEPGKAVSIEKIELSSGKQTIQKRFQGIENAIKWLNANPNYLVELSIAVDKHLTASEKKQLLEAHEGIIRIIPEFTNPDLLKFTSGKKVDLTKNIDALFEDYFLYKKGQAINEELKNLFKEVINVSDNT
ncbi:MAG: exonuclease subunit SbcD [Bacteroidia bacterium]|nr:exonuclease subunit SbcD [Bacteroidia bacterium]